MPRINTGLYASICVCLSTEFSPLQNAGHRGVYPKGSWDWESNLPLFTTRAYARAVLGVVILSVYLSVRLSHAWIVTKLNDALRIF